MLITLLPIVAALLLLMVTGGVLLTAAVALLLVWFSLFSLLASRLSFNEAMDVVVGVDELLDVVVAGKETELVVALLGWMPVLGGVAVAAAAGSFLKNISRLLCN
jgi:hypothetical protein